MKWYKCVLNQYNDFVNDLSDFNYYSMRKSTFLHLSEVI